MRYRLGCAGAVAEFWMRRDFITLKQHMVGTSSTSFHLSFIPLLTTDFRSRSPHMV